MTALVSSGKKYFQHQLVNAQKKSHQVNDEIFVLVKYYKFIQQLALYLLQYYRQHQA
jgi:hypothetical protein